MIKDKILPLADAYAHCYAFVKDDSMPIARAALVAALDAADREVEGLQREVQQQALARENVSKMRKTLMDENKKLREALEKLARLGNGEQYGNSIGNEIARAVLEGK
jgi:hypothetical protein